MFLYTEIINHREQRDFFQIVDIAAGADDSVKLKANKNS